jgi:hypothetical protein
MNAIKAEYTRRTGFRDEDVRPEVVTILGFVEGTYEPGYQRYGSKSCTLAIIAYEGGRLDKVELCDLRYIRQGQAKEGEGK